MTDQKLKKCPCCPSGIGEAVEIAGMWIVRCNVCGITTQLRDTLEEAAADWNRRPEETCPCCGSDLDMRRDSPPFTKAVRLLNAALKNLGECNEEEERQIVNAFFTVSFQWRTIKVEGTNENEGDQS